MFEHSACVLEQSTCPACGLFDFAQLQDLPSSSVLILKSLRLPFESPTTISLAGEFVPTADMPLMVTLDPLFIGATCDWSSCLYCPFACA